MENVVRIEELEDCIARTIAAIHRGCALARVETGAVVDLPKEVQFTVTVVKDWQALTFESGQNSETTTLEGGGTTERSIGTETGHQERTGTDSKKEEAQSKDTRHGVTSDTQTTSGNEQRTNKESAVSKDDGERTSESQSQQDNAHNQQSRTTFTPSS